MTKQISRYCLRIGDAIQEADDGEWVRYRDVARFLPGYDRGREHPDTWPAVEPPASRSVQRRVAAMKGEPAPDFSVCDCPKHPFDCHGHPTKCGCAENRGAPHE